jgi:hypothetical protein
MQIIALFIVIAFVLSAIPISMLDYRFKTGSFKGFWAS